MLHHGIDLHKHSLVIGTVDEAGDRIGLKRLRTRRADIVRYLASPPGPRVKAISAAKVKTDAVDASTLAQLLRAGLIPEAQMLDPELRPYRDLLRLRQRLVNRRSGEQCAIGSLLEKYNERAVDDLPALPRVEASMHADQIELLGAQIKEIESTLREVLLGLAPVQRLRYIPDFGTTVAFTVFLETGTATRFASDRHYTSYCRLVPAAKNSGGKTQSRSSKRYLKNAFINAAVRAVQYEPVVKAWYKKKLRRKPKPVAQTLVAKELARIAYRVLSDDLDYAGTFKGVPIEHPKAPRWPRRASPFS